MAGLYSHTTRSTGTVLTATIYNADHQNHIDNYDPELQDDYSPDVATMRAATDPGESGSESLATSAAGEFERIRFVIDEIIGKDYWYESPATSIETLNTSVTLLNNGTNDSGAVLLGGNQTLRDGGFNITSHNLGANVNGTSVLNSPNPLLGNSQFGTVDGNLTVAPPLSSCYMEIVLLNDTTGGYTFTFPQNLTTASLGNWSSISGEMNTTANVTNILQISVNADLSISDLNIKNSLTGGS